MGEGGGDAEQDGVPDGAALADEVGGHEGLAVAGREGVGGPERGREQQQWRLNVTTPCSG